MRLAIICFSVLTVLLICGSGEAREWVDSTGQHRVSAELIGVQDDTVFLRREDGRILQLPLARLSAKDRAFLRDQATAKSEPPPRESKPAGEASDSNASRSSSVAKDSASSEMAAHAQPVQETDPAEQRLAGRANGILREHCFRCHGENESDEGGFDFALNREKLVSSGYVLPKAAADSPLFERMISKDSPMPPHGEAPRPSAEDLEVIKEWIKRGAPSATQPKPNAFVSAEDVYRWVAKDLKSLDRRDRSYARYFTTTHLSNAGVSAEELQTYRLALAKLLNSLSWNRQLAKLHSVGDQSHLFRIDLRDLRWSAETWEQILAQYPHGLVIDSREAFRVRTDSACEVPLIRADWFVATASRPPLYHDLAQIPTTDRKLEALLQVNVEQNIEQRRVIRSGFARSGVSQNNRLIERHESIFGAYWKSYDFAGNTGRKNLFETPVGPGSTAASFAHDGGEIIFRLPNGMLGFMLTDELGRRIDRGPIEIVSDPRQPDRTVVNGVSCMSCHYGGFIQKTDEIRRHVLANQGAYRNADEILALYPESSVTEKNIEVDTKEYLAVLAKPEIGIPNPTRNGEPVVLIANRYQNELDLKLASAELGLAPQAFRQAMEKLSDPVLTRNLGALGIRGGVVKRESFDEVFISLATTLRLGDRPVAVKRVARNALAGNSKRIPARSNQIGIGAGASSQTAEKALAAGIKALQEKKWEVAEDEFAIALRLSPDDSFTARVYEHAILLYERGQSVTPLIAAHKFLLDSCVGTSAIKQARADFFNSLIRFIRKPTLWRQRWRSSTDINWGVEFPTSVSNAVAAVFEKQLQETPQHEPSLWVMQSYWTKVRDNPQKRLEILTKLYHLLAARGEQLDPMLEYDLGNLATIFGDAEQGATLLGELAENAKAERAAFLRLSEATAWIRARQLEKAISPLKVAEAIFERNGAAHVSNLVKIGDLFVSANRPDLATGAYRAALRLEKNSSQIAQIQQKATDAIAAAADLKLAASDSETSTGSAPGQDNPESRQADQEMSDLLDPTRPFRAAAEKHEQDAVRSPSLAVYNYEQAAKNWISAEDPARATAALLKLTKALRRARQGGSEHQHKSAAHWYEQVGRNKEALQHWIETLKRCQSNYSATEFQSTIKTLMDEDSSLSLPAGAKELLDPRYPDRMMARRAESQKTSNASIAAGQLVSAAQSWAKAGDADDVRRVGLKAEAALKRLGPDTVSQSAQERNYLSLAGAYRKVGLHQLAVSSYANAIAMARRDDDAMKYHQQIESICREHGLPLPELTPETAVKLDPLNRHRVKAQDYETRAKKQTRLSRQLSYWNQASESWLEAEEHARAVKAADRAVGLLMKKDNASDYDFRKAAELYKQIGEKERAIQAYQKAIERCKYDSQKKRYQDEINALQ